MGIFSSFTQSKQRNQETKDYYEETPHNLAQTIEELQAHYGEEDYYNLNNKEFFQDVVSSLRTISDLIRWVYTYLSRHDVYFGHGYTNAWDEARTLVLLRLELPLDVDSDYILNARVTKAEKIDIIHLTSQRVHAHIPLAYLLNRARFLNRDYYVDKRVIIPRSPMGELINDGFMNVISSRPNRILDMCTGSGVLAIAMAERFPSAQIDGVDISEDALDVANYNLEISAVTNIEERLAFIESDLFNNLPEGSVYDLIVSNPPYVNAEDLADMPEEYRHEPAISLGSGEDGLDITRRLLVEAPKYLRPQGVLIVEVGNSRYDLEEQLPKVPFKWLQLKNGGHGIFAITREQLLDHAASIKTFAASAYPQE